MLNRNLFDNQIHKAIQKIFTVLDIAINKLSMSEEELFQEGRAEIWDCLQHYKPGKSPFSYFIAMALKSLYRDMEKLMEFGRKKTVLYTDSLYTQIGEEQTYMDILPEKVNVEKTVIKKIMFERKLSVLEENEKETFLLYLKGYSINEISQLTNVSKTGTNSRLKRAVKKLSGRVINLQELGTRNYKRGA